jgi:glutathione S-transferase
MKLYLFPPSARVLGIVALKNHLALDCEIRSIDLGRGDQLTPDYIALNPNKKMPTLEDDGLVLWESNAILFYMSAKCPVRSLWPSDVKGQADVLRWLAWQSAHWDAESVGMVTYEKNSKAVLGIGPANPDFVARGEQKQDLPHWRPAHDRRLFHRSPRANRRAPAASHREVPRNPSLVRKSCDSAILAASRCN